MRPFETSSAWERFLAAEAAGRTDEAEAALAALFAAAPPVGPSPGFADRVMARIAVVPRSIFARPLVRFALAASLLLAALSSALLAPALLPLARLVSLADLAGAGTRALGAVAVRFAAGVSLWERTAEVLATVGRALTAPSSLLFVLAQFVVAALALRGLVRLTRERRSSSHEVHATLR